MLTLRELRESRGMSQRELADLLRVSPAVYVEYERDPDQMTIPETILICRSLSYDIDTLFNVKVS